MPLDRRTFLKGAAGVAGAAVGASLPVLDPPPVHAGRDYDIEPSLPVDKVVRTTCSPNCTGSCGQLAFVRDGKVVKVQQAADYPDGAYNPRGCMKGISYQLHIYGEDRITTPLVRTGVRGSGEFREASWDEVLDTIAAELKRIGETYGWDSIHVFDQVPGSGYIQKGANYRACATLGMIHGTSFDFNGDLPMGMPITFGVQNAEHEAKDWANSRFLLLIGSNPVETRIPDVHFLFDAIEAGAKLVVVDPNYSPTASKADAWLAIRPGTDTAFALGMANVILGEGLADLAFMRTYTDGPLLVSLDTGRRLRWSELAGVGPQTTPGAEAFVAWDEVRGRPVEVGTDRLGGPGVRSALAGVYDLRLTDGSTVSATPGFALVRAEVERWTPERAAEVCEIPADRITTIARAYATTKPAAILMGGGSNHWFHGDQTGRALALLAALTGNIGRSGGGFSVYVGQYKVRVNTAPWYNVGDEHEIKAKIVPSIYFAHGRTPTMHPDVPYPENGWHALVCAFANMFVQGMDVNHFHETLAALDLIVVIDHQRTHTVEWADIVLPATTWYEKWDLTATPLHPFLQLQQPAIDPVGESRSELWVWRELVRRIDPEAAAAWFDLDEEAAIEAILAAGGGPGGPTEGITLEQLKAGPVRLNVPDPDIPFLGQIERLEPFPPRSLPAPLEATAAFIPTRRIEFYKEEDRFIELGETVPTYLPPKDDEVHDPATWPLTLLTPHSKWRIHSSYANNPWLAEIHGGRPIVQLHPDDAAARSIADGDTVEIFNTRGTVECWAHVTEGARRGAATLYEGWWPRQFRKGKGVNELTSSAVNPIHEIHNVPNMWCPSTGWKDCRVEIRRTGEGTDA
jgi:anaerobic selenocysteine-containing dehydrogenase